MADEKMTADRFVRDGYEVQPTSNGGFLVTRLHLKIGDYVTHMDAGAAFTNSTDFLAWLTAGHAAYDKGAPK